MGNDNKNIFYVEADVMNIYVKFQLHRPYDFWGEDFLICFENLPFMLPWQPVKFSDLDKIHMNRRGLLKKHFWKKKILISAMRQQKLPISTFPIKIQWKL